MNKIFIVILLFIVNNQTFSQNYITPLKSNSFGLNHHTNRDIAYFSHIDSNKNTIVIGTTEKDSTFTDIITTKLDTNNNLIWQKRFSLPTDLSYDVPVKSFISSNNEIYIIGRSSFHQSNSNGLIFILKYGENGNLIYSKHLGNLDASDYDDYGYLDAALNNDGSLSLVYEPNIYQSYQGNTFHFLKIDTNGNTVSSFIKEIINNGVIGLIDSGVYYLLVKKQTDNYTSDDYTFYRIESSSVSSSFQISDTTFLNYYYNIPLQDLVKLTVDSKGNFYLACSKTVYSEKTINFSKINNNNQLEYSITTSTDKNYSLVGEFINDQDENIVVANNITDGSVNFFTINQNNAIQTLYNYNNLQASGFKKNKDNTFFITTSNSNIRLFSNNYTELNSFNTSDTYELVDFSKIDDNTITAVGTKYNKMFPESDFYTQLNIVAEKIDETQVLNNYIYSGIGTSKVFGEAVLVDSHNNYLVLVHERLGPKFNGIGAANPPINNRVIKYDSNFNVLWELEIPNTYNILDNIFKLDNDDNLYIITSAINDVTTSVPGYKLIKISPAGEILYSKDAFYWARDLLFNQTEVFLITPGSIYENTTYLDETRVYTFNKDNGELINLSVYNHKNLYKAFNDTNGDVFFYMYEKIQYENKYLPKLFLYKENNLVFEKNIFFNTYDRFGVSLIDDNNDLIFMTHPRYAYSAKQVLHKLSLNQNYTHKNIDDRIRSLKKLQNGKLFIITEDNKFKVYNNDFSLFSENQTELFEATGSSTLVFNNYFLYSNSFYDRFVKVFNENSQLIYEFNIDYLLGDTLTKKDQDGNLIFVGTNENQIYTYSEYSWSRGYIKKINLNSAIDGTLSINRNLDNNKPYTIYPNPTTGIVNINIPEESIKKVLVYDITGKSLKKFNNSKIDLKDLKTGIYFIKIFTKSNTIINSKVFKI